MQKTVIRKEPSFKKVVIISNKPFVWKEQGYASILGEMCFKQRDLQGRDLKNLWESREIWIASTKIDQFSFCSKKISWQWVLSARWLWSIGTIWLAWWAPIIQSLDWGIWFKYPPHTILIWHSLEKALCIALISHYIWIFKMMITLIFDLEVVFSINMENP